jgi:hypothetical protein
LVSGIFLGLKKIASDFRNSLGIKKISNTTYFFKVEFPAFTICNRGISNDNLEAGKLLLVFLLDFFACYFRRILRVFFAFLFGVRNHYIQLQGIFVFRNLEYEDLEPQKKKSQKISGELKRKDRAIATTFFKT